MKWLTGSQQLRLLVLAQPLPSARPHDCSNRVEVPTVKDRVNSIAAVLSHVRTFKSGQPLSSRARANWLLLLELVTVDVQMAVLTKQKHCAPIIALPPSSMPIL